MSMQWEFDAIGTKWRIDSPQVGTNSLQDAVRARIDAFDQTYSRFRTDSLVWKMSQYPGAYQLPPDGGKLMKFYQRLYQLSGGKVTPLIGKTMEQAGYDKDYNLVPKKLTPVIGWKDALAYTQQCITIKKPGVLLDFGAAGKGYLVDIIATMLRGFGHDEFVINAGGDIWVEKEPKQVVLEDPNDIERALGYVEVGGRAVCGSSPVRRTWGEYHHIIDPTTLKSESTIKAVWVIADECMIADGLATALSFVEPDILRKQFNFEYAMIEQGNIRMSKNFKVTLFASND